MSDQVAQNLVYRTDLHQIFRVSRTMAVDDQSEISFLIPQGTLPWQPIFWVLSAELMQAASGTAGRANVGLCLHLYDTTIDAILMCTQKLA